MPSNPADDLRARLLQLAEPARLLEQLFANAPVGFQVYERSGRCAFVNRAFIELFGAAPPDEYNLFEDTLVASMGLADIVKRAFGGERMSIPVHWYDIRELRNLPPGVDVSNGRRIAIAAELMPLSDSEGEVSHVLLAFNDQTAAWVAREEAESAARNAARARFAADVRATHHEFLAKAARLLSSTLDLDLTLRRVAEATLETLADLCVIDLVNADGSLRRVAALHRDPSRQQIVDELLVRFPLHPSSPAMQVFASGQPQLVSEIDSEYLAAHSSSNEHASLLLRLHIRSGIICPLRSGDRNVGAISLGYTDTGRYTETDLQLVEALASHAAIAIDNARLFHAAEQARREAESANRAKDEFLAILGHELRNPLAPIVTALEVTRKREGTSHERAIIERHVDHLRRLVDDLLDVSRIASGALELHTTAFELADVVIEGFELARAPIEQRHHQVSIDVPRGLTLHGDRVRLAQVVANLLINASRYTDTGGQIMVVGSRAPDAEEIVLRVRDTGVGMTPELISQVFDAFMRGGLPADRTTGGLGLGLAIVKSLTELHGGRVAARSDGPGHGSEFEVVLPIRNMAVSRTRTPSVPPPPQPGLRERGVILIVDDNTDAAQLLGDALETYGFKTVVTHSPESALEAAHQHQPRVAVLDIGLPKIDGYELARQLRAVCPDVRCVALSGYARDSGVRATDAGFVDHLIKPIRLPTLIPLLDGLLARS